MFNRKGFTLIELLIVVVIIGILAAIAIPKFANTKEKAFVSTMKSDLRNLMTAEETYYVEVTGAFADDDHDNRYRLSVHVPVDKVGNTAAEATEIRLRRGKGRKRSDIAFDWDVDFYSVVAVTSLPMIVDLSSPGRPEDAFDGQITIYDSSGSEMASHNDPVGGGAGFLGEDVHEGVEPSVQPLDAVEAVAGRFAGATAPTAQPLAELVGREPVQEGGHRFLLQSASVTRVEPCSQRVVHRPVSRRTIELEQLAGRSVGGMRPDLDAQLVRQILQLTGPVALAEETVVGAF